MYTNVHTFKYLSHVHFHERKINDVDATDDAYIYTYLNNHIYTLKSVRHISTIFWSSLSYK